METTNREITRKMSASERKMEDARLLERLDRRDQLDKDRKASAARFKSQIADCEAEIGETRSRLASGQITVTTKCRVERNDRVGVVEYVDIATGEVVDSRALTAMERQIPLPSGGGDDDNGLDDLSDAPADSFAGKVAAAAEASQGDADDALEALTAKASAAAAAVDDDDDDDDDEDL